MDHNEVVNEMAMEYETLVKYLLGKYGAAKYDYFKDPSCEIENLKKSRTIEGLFCHHIDEDKGYNLSSKQAAREQSFEYQKAHRLVYCNYLEHLLLHILIGKKQYWKEHKTFSQPKEFDFFLVPGILYICGDLNKLFDCNGGKIAWRNQDKCFKEVADNFDDYIYILRSFIDYLRKR